jgi:hypothetical protein
MDEFPVTELRHPSGKVSTEVSRASLRLFSHFLRFRVTTRLANRQFPNIQRRAFSTLASTTYHLRVFYHLSSLVKPGQAWSSSAAFAGTSRASAALESTVSLAVLSTVDYLHTIPFTQFTSTLLWYIDRVTARGDLGGRQLDNNMEMGLEEHILCDYHGGFAWKTDPCLNYNGTFRSLPDAQMTGDTSTLEWIQEKCFTAS